MKKMHLEIRSGRFYYHFYSALAHNANLQQSICNFGRNSHSTQHNTLLSSKFVLWMRLLFMSNFFFLSFGRRSTNMLYFAPHFDAQHTQRIECIATQRDSCICNFSMVYRCIFYLCMCFVDAIASPHIILIFSQFAGEWNGGRWSQR